MSDWDDTSQGSEATRSGRFLEEIVAREFASLKVPVQDWSVNRGNHDLLHPSLLLRHVPFTSIYCAAAYSEFVYVHHGIALARIECKWQGSTGSIDEKFPYVALNAEHAMTEPHVVIVHGGDGARACSLAWVRAYAKRVTSKQIHVVTVAEARRLFKKLVRWGTA